jgi:hypothetical protein
MRAIGFSVIVIVASAVAGAAVWAITEPRAAFSKDDPAFEQAGDPGKGRLVFAAGDCASCTPKPDSPTDFDWVEVWRRHSGNTH